jgi:ADP-ribose pyrophosphatase YjhB (NUDIX family)
LGRPQRIEILARGLLIERGAILICRSVRAGYGFLPGGHVEFGESASGALRREFFEESGLDVHVKDCALVTEEVFQSGKHMHHELNVVFHVERTRASDSSSITSREVEIAFEWVDLAAISRMDLRPPTVRDWLLRRGTSKAIHSTVTWGTSIHQ